MQAGAFDYLQNRKDGEVIGHYRALEFGISRRKVALKNQLKRVQVHNFIGDSSEIQVFRL
jgi:hypothetical protein